MLDILTNNWQFILGILFLVLFASIIYTRIIKNNEIFEQFGCEPQLGMLPPQDRPSQPIPTIINGQLSELRGSDLEEMPSEALKLNETRPKCSNYIINSPPISSMFNIDDMCHTDNKKEQLEWNCFYRYQLEKNLLKDPKWANNLYRKDYPVFYRV